MSKEMNKLETKITKYDIVIGLFMSLIIALIFSYKIAIVYLLGIMIGMLNFLVSSYSTRRWLSVSKTLILTTSLARVVIVVMVILPFIHHIQLVLAYLVGFIMHYLVMIYCTLSMKGSV